MVTRRDLVIFILTSSLMYMTFYNLNDTKSDNDGNEYKKVHEIISMIKTEEISTNSIRNDHMKNNTFDGGDNKQLMDNFLPKSMINLPEWYRNNDWGLIKNSNVTFKKIWAKGNNAEEITAWSNFFFGTTKGLMLEMGAMNGITRSVSLLFEQTLNWRTILIEANPRLAIQLNKNRPNSLRFNLAICDSIKTVHYISHKTRDEVNGILEFMSIGFFKIIWPELLLSNDNPNWDKIKNDTRVQEIPCVPLMNILLPFGITHINFFLLDVENAELAVLKSIDFNKIKFDVISIETNRGVDDINIREKYIDTILTLLISKGYIIWNRMYGPNTWVIHPDFIPFKQ